MTESHSELPSSAERRTTDADGHDCVDPLGVAVITVSSSRGTATDTDPSDPGGDAVETVLVDAGHVVTSRRTIPDDYVRIKTTVGECLERPDVDLVVTTGGTGVTVDDVTPDAVSELFDRELPGFGEAFRRLSWEEVGTRVVATRATAGIARDVPVFVLPGSVNAVKLATAEIIAEEAPHLAGLATRYTVGETDA
jgi:molybdenum cofactor biosynthesis protein B